MNIVEITIENYKIFFGKHDFPLKKNLLFLVGENNSGKSTFFEAIDFIKFGVPQGKKVSDLKNKFAAAADAIRCTAKFQGKIKDVIRDFSDEKYLPYVFLENDIETVIVQRSSEGRQITQNGKQKTLDAKTVTLWNGATNQFENPSGVDTVLGSLFEAQFVWADTDPADVSDFGSTKICGRLLHAAVGDFFNGSQWSAFEEIHKETFHGEDDSISKRAEAVEQGITEILNTQYGNGDVEFNFSLPDPSAFLKAGQISVDDGVKTPLNEKGTGMQRAVALAAIQVYAKNLIMHPENPEKTKPLFFFIDEPENCLHPIAQKKLIDALVTISSSRQIFVSTHSPFILKQFNSENHDLMIFERESGNVKITNSEALSFFPWSPSWGEINYKAYGIPTIEFHNELYGYLQEKFAVEKEAEVETFLVRRGQLQTKQWTRVRGGTPETPRAVTLMTFVRNTIHHPENRQNANFTDAELKKSIDDLITVLNT